MSVDHGRCVAATTIRMLSSTTTAEPTTLGEDVLDDDDTGARVAIVALCALVLIVSLWMSSAQEVPASAALSTQYAENNTRDFDNLAFQLIVDKNPLDDDEEDIVAGNDITV